MSVRDEGVPRNSLQPVTGAGERMTFSESNWRSMSTWSKHRGERVLPRLQRGPHKWLSIAQVSHNNIICKPMCVLYAPLCIHLHLEVCTCILLYMHACIDIIHMHVGSFNICVEGILIYAPTVVHCSDILFDIILTFSLPGIHRHQFCQHRCWKWLAGCECWQLGGSRTGRIGLHRDKRLLNRNSQR